MLYEDTLLQQILDSTRPYVYPEVEQDAGIDDHRFIIRFKIHNDSVIYDSVMLAANTYEYSLKKSFTKEVRKKYLFIPKQHQIVDTNKYYLAFDWGFAATQYSLMQPYIKGGKIKVTVKQIPIETHCGIVGQTITTHSDSWPRIDEYEKVSLSEKKDTDKVGLGGLIPKDSAEKMIEGVVIDRKTNKPLSYTDIDIKVTGKIKDARIDSTYKVFTNENGFFQLFIVGKLNFSILCCTTNYNCIMINEIKRPKRYLIIKLAPL